MLPDHRWSAHSSGGAAAAAQQGACLPTVRQDQAGSWHHSGTQLTLSSVTYISHTHISHPHVIIIAAWHKCTWNCMACLDT